MTASPPDRILDSLVRTCARCELREMCMPANMDDENLADLSSRIRRTPQLRPGEYLLHAGEPATALYAVRTGSFKSVRLLHTGEEHVVGIHIRGDLFGLDGLKERSHEVDVVALENASACVVPLEQLEDHLHLLPRFCRNLLSMVGHGAVEEQHRHVAMTSHLAEERLVRFLIRYAERLGARNLMTHEFSLPLSRKDLANYLGLQLPTVSRAFSKLRDEGVLDVDQRLITIRQPERLYELATLDREDAPRPLDTHT